MKKLLIILFCLSAYAAQSQVLQEPTIYGTLYKNIGAKNAILLPTICGTPILDSALIKYKQGAIIYDSCGHHFYGYDPSTAIWSMIQGLTPTIATLEAGTFPVNSTVIVQDSLRGGIFNYVATAIPDSGTVFSRQGGGYWQRKYDGNIMVTWFGAKHDSITNDANAIQLAINYASSLQGKFGVTDTTHDYRAIFGATVYFPTGIYLINNSVNWLNNVNIQGAGLSATEILVNTGVGIDGFYTNQPAVSYNIMTARDMEFIGQGFNCRDLIHIVTGRLFFSNILCDIAGRYGMYLDGSINSRFEKCRFGGNKSHNFYLASQAIFSTTCVFADCYFSASIDGSGIMVENAITYFPNSIFESNGSGGGTADSTGWGAIVKIGYANFSGSYSEANYNGGLWLGQTRTPVSHNNTFVVNNFININTFKKPSVRIDEASNVTISGDYNDDTASVGGTYQFYPLYGHIYDITSSLADSEIVFYNRQSGAWPTDSLTGSIIPHDSITYVGSLITKSTGLAKNSFFGINSTLFSAGLSGPKDGNLILKSNATRTGQIQFGTSYYDDLNNTLNVISSGSGNIVADSVTKIDNAGSTILRVGVGGVPDRYLDLEENSGSSGPFRFGSFADANMVNSYSTGNDLYGKLNFVTNGATRMSLLQSGKLVFAARPKLGVGDSLAVYSKVQVDSLHALGDTLYTAKGITTNTTINAGHTTIILDSAYMDSTVRNINGTDASIVHIAGTETITGEKTFNTIVTSNSSFQTKSGANTMSYLSVYDSNNGQIGLAHYNGATVAYGLLQAPQVTTGGTSLSFSFLPYSNNRVLVSGIKVNGVTNYADSSGVVNIGTVSQSKSIKFVS
ncbi:MAG TPA: glycosyl hydrolase family 28-related protein, partial [Hanamia sp.]